MYNVLQHSAIRTGVFAKYKYRMYGLDKNKRKTKAFRNLNL